MAEHLLEVENLKMYFKKVNGVFRRKTSYVKAVDTSMRLWNCADSAGNKSSI